MIEKLIELQNKAHSHLNSTCIGHGCDICAYRSYDDCAERIKAEYLIANGVRLEEKQATSDESKRWVPVTDGKPLESFLHPIDAYKGLKAKYLVFKADTGEKVENCFVLRPDKDTVAVEALRAYAHATDNKTLSNDIYNWVGKGVTVQKWIPVTERLPEPETEVVILAERKYYSFKEKSVTTHHIVTTGMYEDGSKNTEDSNWVWETDGFEYDEELDAYIIPEGWWEWKHYIDDECHNYAIDDVVTHWMPLPSTEGLE